MKIATFLTTFFSITLFCISSWAQSSSAIPSNIRATNTADRLSDGGLAVGELLIGIPVPAGEVIGNYYLNENWKKTTLMLMNTDKLAEGYMCRYNIQSNQIEVKNSTGVSAISGSKIKSFVWIDADTDVPTYFVNAQDYSIEGVKQSGFLTVLVDGQLPFFKKTTIVIRQPDYKPELHMGSRDTQILKKDIYYYSKGSELIEVKGRNKKKFLEIFEDFSVEIDKFIQSNSLDISNEINRVMIFEYYNKNKSKI